MDIFKLFGEVVVDTKKAIDALNETADEAEKTGESAKKIGDGFKKNGDITAKKLEEIAKKANKTTDEVKSEAEKLARAYVEAGDDAKTAMRKAYKDIEVAADKASKGSKESGKNIIDAFKKISVAGAAVVAAIAAIGAAMVSLADETRAYRLEMGKLETAFDSAGHTTEEANAVYQELYSILGETERAVEASQHIAKLCETEEEMKAMTDACIGAFALFDDSLPIEGLMEAANETAKTGQLTGVLIDALNWAGSSEEAFQEKLNACNTERARAALITEELISLYADSADAYKKNNKDVIAATKAQEKLTAATARWGETVEPIVTLYREKLAQAINLAADALERMIDPSGVAGKAIAGTAETSEEAAAKMEELRVQIENLNKTQALLWTEEGHQELMNLTAALEIAESQYYELAEAERLAAEEVPAITEETAQATAKFNEITDQYVADAQALFEKFAETYEGIYNKVSGFFDPFEKASISVRTNVTKMMTAMQSQIDFNNSYTANLQALKDYGLGSLADAFQSYGAEGAAYAKAIVDAVEKAGGATTEKGQEIIQGFVDINQQVTESESELAQTMALMNGEFEAELQDMTDSYQAAVDALDKSAEANTAAIETFEGFLQGMNKKLPEIESKMTNFGKEITKALQKGIGSVSVPVTFSGSIPGLDVGMDYVPYDNYLAYLHKGEAVLTAEEANAWRAGKATATDGNSSNSGSGSSGGGVTVIQNIETVPQTPVELASVTAAYFEQARWVT